MTWAFTDNNTGEDFFVEADTREEAQMTADEYFEAAECYGTVTEEFADRMGWDTY